MNNRHPACPGCGALFQSVDPARPGYLPPEIPIREGVICRRCYRLTHYNREEGRPLPPEEARRMVAETIASAGAVLYLADLGDLEGSLPPPGLIPPGSPVLLAVNKIDLLPPKAVGDEVTAWLRQRWMERAVAPPPVAVVGISAAKGQGIRTLRETAQAVVGRWGRLAVVGPTSVGKSTLLRRLVATETGPTVARYPGTTQAPLRWELPEGLILYDTPGLSPGDRLIDLLCPACAARLVPARRLASKLFRLRRGEAVLMGSFASFTLEDGPECVVLLYAGEEVLLHRTKAEKAAHFLATRPAWLTPPRCGVCLGLELTDRPGVELDHGEDLAVAGLGWISLRGGPGRFHLTVPAGVRWVRRPALFGPRPKMAAG